MIVAGPLPVECKCVQCPYYLMHPLGIRKYHKHADKRAKNRATPYRIIVLPLLNCRGCKQLNTQGVLYGVIERIMI
jgi:hypothetical protein